jgi:hypothetical protein
VLAEGLADASEVGEAEAGAVTEAVVDPVLAPVGEGVVGDRLAAGAGPLGEGTLAVGGVVARGTEADAEADGAATAADPTAGTVVAGGAVTPDGAGLSGIAVPVR